MNKKPVICITGMHRSGTSLAASWLQGCGLNIHDGSFWGPGPGNPRGHFEDKDFVALHNAAIINENSASKGWIVFPPKPMFFITDEHLSQAFNLVEVRNAKYDIWGWKDPRTTLFLEQWGKILPSLKVVMVWRPCAEVVQSLIRRSKKAEIPVMKIGLIRSIRLWKCYNKHLIEFKKKHPQDALLFSLQSMVNSDRQILNRINSEFQIDLDYTPIETIFDRSLLTRGKVSYYHRTLGRYFGSQPLEKRLEDFSEQLEVV